MLGTAAAYGYRSYYGHPDPAQTPPVITADNSTPNKIVPTAAVDPQSNKVIQDRLATATREQLVSKQEEPVALKELGTHAAPRVVLPAPVAPVQAAPSQTGSTPPQPTASTNAPGAGANEPKKVRTVDHSPRWQRCERPPVAAPPPLSSQPPAAANARQITPPAPRATAPARNGTGPISLDPQASPSERARPRRRAHARPWPLHRRPGMRRRRVLPADSWCSSPRKSPRPTRDPRSAACKPSSPTSWRTASRSFGAPISASKESSTGPWWDRFRRRRKRTSSAPATRPLAASA